MFTQDQLTETLQEAVQQAAQQYPTASLVRKHKPTAEAFHDEDSQSWFIADPVGEVSLSVAKPSPELAWQDAWDRIAATIEPENDLDAALTGDNAPNAKLCDLGETGVETGGNVGGDIGEFATGAVDTPQNVARQSAEVSEIQADASTVVTVDESQNNVARDVANAETPPLVSDAPHAPQVEQAAVDPQQVDGEHAPQMAHAVVDNTDNIDAAVDNLLNQLSEKTCEATAEKKRDEPPQVFQKSCEVANTVDEVPTQPAAGRRADLTRIGHLRDEVAAKAVEITRASAALKLLKGEMKDLTAALSADEAEYERTYGHPAERDELGDDSYDGNYDEMLSVPYPPCPVCCVPAGAVHLANCPEPDRIAEKYGYLSKAGSFAATADDLDAASVLGPTAFQQKSPCTTFNTTMANLETGGHSVAVPVVQPAGAVSEQPTTSMESQANAVETSPLGSHASQISSSAVATADPSHADLWVLQKYGTSRSQTEKLNELGLRTIGHLETCVATGQFTVQAIKGTGVKNLGEKAIKNVLAALAAYRSMNVTPVESRVNSETWTDEETARWDGLCCAKKGGVISANPHERGSQLALEWDRGFTECEGV